MLAERQPASWFLIAAAALLASIAATFAEVAQAGFVSLDDGNNIFLHPQLGALTWDRVQWAFSDVASARRYLPLGWLGLSAVITVQGYEPAGFHLASLAWHAVASLALLAATRQVLRLYTAPADRIWGPAVALVTTAAWALHPLRTETVAWASGLLYTQATAFAMAAFWLWTLRWTMPQRKHELAAGALAAFVASLLTYPIALGLPVACWILDRSWATGPLRAIDATALPPRRRTDPWVLVFAAAALVVLLINILARRHQAAEFAAVAAWSDFGLAARTLQALYVWGRYLEHWIWPAHPSPIYADLFALEPPAHAVLARALGAAALMVVLAGWGRRQRLVWGAVGTYTAMALPFLGLLEHPWIAHDRYASLLHPVLGLAAAVVLLQVRSRAWRSVTFAGLAGLVLAGAAGAHGLVAHWQDENRFEARLRATLPRTPVAGYFLGYLPASVHFLNGRFAAIDPALARAEIDAPGWSADATRREFQRLIAQHEEFIAQNWPGRELPPLALLHYLHGRAALDRSDTRTACAHFAAALVAAPTFSAAADALARCEGRPRRAD